LNIEWVGMGQLQGDGFVHTRMNQLDLCGTSGLAPFYLNMKRGLDVLLSLENADPERVAMTGLSGGGWQTIVLSSLDARIKLTNPVAGYSSFLTRTRHYKDLGDSEQTPCDLATVADYAHLTAMMAPRATLLTYNAKDECCFESGYALQPLLDAAQPVFRLFGKPDALRSHVNDNPGTHNYEVDNRQAFYRMLGDFFYPGSSDFDAKEIPSDSEVKPAEELRIDLPADNQSFNTLALALSRELPRQAELPANATDAGTWQTARLAQLRDIVRAKDYQVAASEAGRETSGTVTAVFWRLMMDSDWTVPVVEFSGEQADKIAILVADGGRESLTAEVPRRLAAGYRVLAVDPFYFGESKIRQSDWLFALLVGAVGERPLGLQASQLAAVARWAASRYEGLPITLAAVGPRTSTAALVAASLEAKTIAAVELQQALGSLKEVIEKNWVVNQAPELFCFGLLEVSDLKQLVALTAPRPVKFVEPSERVKRELAGIGDWYRTLGSQHDPLAP
jgi:dienelactone hydrolase